MNTQPEENLPELTVDGLTSPAPIGKIIELRNKGLTLEQIGKIVGRTKQAISLRLKPFMPAIDNLKSIKEQRADTLHVISDTLLNSLTEADINKMSGLQKITGAAVLYDKERLERGQSTANIAYNDQSKKLSELDKEIQALEAELGVGGEEGE